MPGVGHAQHILVGSVSAGPGGLGPLPPALPAPLARLVHPSKLPSVLSSQLKPESALLAVFLQHLSPISKK